MTRRDHIALVWLCVSMAGCLSDDLVDFGQAPASQDAGCEVIYSTDHVYVPPDQVVLSGDYSPWLEGDDSFGPDGGEPVICDESHTGWQEARCHECHGRDMGLAPENHDPRMQHWAWSCARGFPGSDCHGHGPNGALWFNHDEDPAFEGCTTDFCHDRLNADERFENHGFTETPDAFCNACHDGFWQAWPEEEILN